MTLRCDLSRWSAALVAAGSILGRPVDCAGETKGARTPSDPRQEMGHPGDGAKERNIGTSIRFFDDKSKRSTP